MADISNQQLLDHIIKLDTKIDQAKNDIISTITTGTNQLVQTVIDQIDTTQAQVGTMQIQLNGVQTQMGTMQTQMGTIQTKMSTMQTQIHQTHKDIKVLHTKVIKIDTKLDTHIETDRTFRATLAAAAQL